MTIEEVGREIRSFCEHSVESDHSFSSTYLQANGGGSQSLSIPSVSASFQWTAHQVAKLGNHRNTIYVLAEKDCKLPEEQVRKVLHDALSIFLLLFFFAVVHAQQK